jgi:hypothetical protein
MAKTIIKEKEVIDHLQRVGFKEVKESEKSFKWYKKATEYPSCLRAVRKKKTTSY